MTPKNASSVLPDLPPGAKVLILRLRSLGDLVLETPAITALHRWRPDLRIAVLAEPRFAPVFEGNPDVDEVIQSRKSLQTAGELRSRGFAAVFNQHGGPRSVLLTRASGAPVRVGWQGFQFSFLYNVTVPRPQEVFGRVTVHTVEHRMSQFYWTGLPRGPIPPLTVVLQPDAEISVGRWLDSWRIEKGNYAVLQPGAKVPAMRWPVAKFAAVARWLMDNHGIPSIVNLDASDAEVALEARQAFKGCGVVADAMNVRELIALIAGARLVVANDSGPAHLAAALQRPSVVIFSHTNPEKWKPWQAPHRIVQTGAVYDSIRGDETIVVSESRPVGAIPVEEVASACAELLSGIASGSQD
ncbi:MAG: glycosyltransferase family 9 protein [Terriglobales bacterium]